MATYRKLKNNKIQAIIRIKGYPTTTKTFAFKKDAKTWVNDTERKMLLGTYTEVSMLPIRELLYEYEKNVGQFKKAYDNGERYQYSALIEAFGDWDISKLTAKVIKGHLNKRMNDGLKGSSAKRYIGLLSRAYEYAITELYIDVENPVKKVKIDSSSRPRNRVLSVEEFEHISCYLPYHIAILAEIAIKTGMRRGELILIKPSDIVDSRLHIRAEITKTGYSRLIPLSEETESLFHSFWKYSPSNISAQSITKAWQRARTKAEITDVTWHDLRHCALTNLAKSGLSVYELSAISGHRELKMLQIYLNGDSIVSDVRV